VSVVFVMRSFEMVVSLMLDRISRSCWLSVFVIVLFRNEIVSSGMSVVILSRLMVSVDFVSW